jgi:hypothetical protein
MMTGFPLESFVATYKFAVLQSLADIAIENLPLQPRSDAGVVCVHIPPSSHRRCWRQVRLRRHYISRNDDLLHHLELQQMVPLQSWGGS